MNLTAWVPGAPAFGALGWKCVAYDTTSKHFEAGTAVEAFAFVLRKDKFKLAHYEILRENGSQASSR